MQRPIFYVLALFFHAAFWLALLLANYYDYTSSAPEILDKAFHNLFEENRIRLGIAELGFPAAMVIASVILMVVKFRAAPVRIPFLLMLFMGVEFWVWRWLFFPDRMASYYAMNDLSRLPGDFSEGHQFALLGYSLFLILILAIREYTVPDNLLDTALANLRQKIRRGEPVD
jgi:hypothetical protein